MRYRIGLVEDNLTEASQINMVLLENAEELDEDSVKRYDLKREEGFKNQLFEEITEDIRKNRIQCLIVDYKLDTLYEIVEGIDIVEHFHIVLPEFPIVILTNIYPEGKENDSADPDKVYAKKDFLIYNTDNSRTMVYNIMRNIKRYAKRRNELEVQREKALNELLPDGRYSDSAYEKLIETERQLSQYVPIELSALDKEYSTEKMNEAISALKKFKELLE